jgi:hypothetical protein
MIETKRPKKCPIGTVREWQSGTVIKAHDNSLYDAGWINMPNLPSYLKDQLRELDFLGKAIAAVKDPVDGILWLDKEITEFETSSGEVYLPQDFKQFSGWYGIEGYSFTSEFSKRYARGKIRLASDINDAILEANEDKCHKTGKSPDLFILTKEEIKKIRDRIKYDFKDEYMFDTNDISELKGVLSRVHKYLQQGENFEDEEQKRVYAKNKEKLARFGDTYERLKFKRQQKEEMMEEINNTFQDNWGIRESFRKKMDTTYSDYISKYLNRIKKDEVEDFEATIKCKINAPTAQFYKSLEESEVMNVEIDLDKWIGKKIPSYYSKYEDVKFIGYDDLGEVIVEESNGHRGHYTYGDSKTELENKLRAREGTDLSIIFQLRFNELYQKSLEGNWDLESVEPLHMFEKVIHYLPEGHCLTNRYFKKLQKSTDWSSASSYAHYSSSDNAIFLSNKAIERTDGFADITNGNEFISTLVHEIGHSVSDKYHRANRTRYRDFARECGWGWDYLNKKDSDSYTATGGTNDIKRTGVNNNVDLITEYAGKSPEEAFAEYYSFYSQYRKEIDGFLDKNDVSGLKKDKQTKVNPNWNKQVKVSEIENIHIDPNLRQKIDAELFSQKRVVGEGINLEFLSPWKLKHVTLNDEALDKKQLRNYINFVKEKDIKPLIGVKDSFGRVKLIGEEAEGYLNLANKVANKPSPVCTVSEEIYNNLKNKGFQDQEIQDYAFFNIKDEKYPLGKDQQWIQKDVSGLRFGQHGVIPHDQIMRNKNIFKKMRTIYYSEELKKALEGVIL